MYNWKTPISIILLVIGVGSIGFGQPPAPPIDVIQRIHSSRLAEDAHSAPIRNLLVLPNTSKLLSCSEDGTICMWDTDTNRLIRRFYKEDQKVFCMAVTSDQKTLITGGTNNQIHSWDLETGKHIQTYQQNRSIYALDICPDDKSFLAGDDTGLTVHWDLKDNKKLAEFTDGTDDITALKVAPDGKTFVTGDSSGTVRKWALDQNDEPLDKLDGLSNWVCCLQFSDDQNELVGSDYSGNVGMWEYPSGKTKWGKGSVASKISWVRFWDENKVLAISTTHELISMNRESGEFSKHKISTPSYCGFDFDRNKEVVFTGGGSFISGWSTTNFDRVFPGKDVVNCWGLKQWTTVGEQLISLSHQNFLVIRNLEDLSVVATIDLNSEFTKANLAATRLIPMGKRLVFFAKSKLCEVDLVEHRLESFVDHKYSVACSSPHPDRILVTDSRKRSVLEISPFETTSAETLVTLSRSFDRLELLNDRFLLLSGGGTHSPFMEIYSVGDRQLISQVALAKNELVKLMAQPNATLQLDKTGNLTGFFPPFFESETLGDDELEAHLNALSSKVFEERKAATHALVRAGAKGLELLDELGPKSAELKYRTEKIRKLIESKGLPDLKRKIEFEFADVQTASLSPSGKLLVIAQKNLWRSDLIIADFQMNGFDKAVHINELGRAECHHQIETIKFENESHLLVGYSNGSIDRFKILKKDE